MIDLLVRGGIVHDGSGSPPYRADVAVDGGHVHHVGRLDGPARQVIDADGLAVAPGFIDGHTHFDAQLSWDPRAEPMLEHGVTTVVTGNCSLSLAPLHPDQRTRLARMFEQIEQVPYDALERGVDWAWEDFPAWVAHLAPRLGINLAPLVGHSALRMWVMGADAHERVATVAEVATMGAVLADALRAGAVGLSISFVDVDEHRRPVPSRLAAPDELAALAAVVGDHGAMLQCVPEYWDTDAMLGRVDELAEWSLATGATTTFSPLLDQTHGLVDAVLARVEAAWARGARVFAQVQPRGLELHHRLCEPGFAFARSRPWREVLALGSTGEQVGRYTDPSVRATLVEAAYTAADGPARAGVERTVISAVTRPEHADLVGRTLADVAAARGCNPAEAMIDVAVADGLGTRFTRPASSNVDPSVLARLLAHPAVLVGASDAGAHVRSFPTSGDTAVLFRDHVRRRPTLSVADAVRRLTADQARAWGLGDRGRLGPGAPADIVVFDPSTIDVAPDDDVADLPGGHARYLRRSVGVAATVVNGTVAWTAAEGYTDQRAGRVVRR